MDWPRWCAGTLSRGHADDHGPVACGDTSRDPVTQREKSLQTWPIQRAVGYELCYTRLREQRPRMPVPADIP
jgi:hypothetical protein